MNFTNAVDSIIKKLNGNAKVKVNVIDQDTVMSGNVEVDGKTTNYLYAGGKFSCDILLNQGVLISSTQEYAVATIIHEALHAYLQYDAGNTINHNLNHTEIANKYIKPFADVLKSMFPSLSLRDATALAWGGLKSTPLWKSSMENDTFNYGNGQTMTFSDLQGVSNSHHSGFADGAHNACGTLIQ